MMLALLSAPRGRVSARRLLARRKGQPREPARVIHLPRVPAASPVRPLAAAGGGR